jgi:hypothetical protein
MLKPLTGTSTSSRVMTGSEAEFLSRQTTAQNGRAIPLHSQTQQAQFSVSRDDESFSRNLDQGKYMSPSRANSANALLQFNTVQNSQQIGSGNGAGASSAANERNSLVALNLKFKTLQEKYQQIIDENAHWQNLLALREAELETQDGKLKNLQQECEKCKREAIVEAKRLQQEHDIELLRLKEQHAKEKTLLLQQDTNSTIGSPTASASVERNLSSPNKSSRGANGSGNDLVQLRQEIANLQEQLMSQKKQLQAEFTQKSQSLQKQHAQEVNHLQSQYALLEDRIVQYEDREDHWRQEKLLSQQQIFSVEQAKKNAERQAEKAKEELKLMQQSVQSSYRMDSHGANSLNSSTGVGNAGTGNNSTLMQNLPNDLETQMRLHDAQYEAKIQQLQHKLTFFKQQYETEKLSLQETQQQVSQLQSKLKKIAIEHDRKVQEVSDSLQENFHLKEQDIRENYENRMQELTLLQQQLSQLSYDRKIKEDANMRLEQQVQLLEKQVSSYQLKCEEHRTIIAQLKERIGQLENENQNEDDNWDEQSLETRESGDNNNTNRKQKKPSKLQTDALLRRLENERQYLKNQLATEVTLKKELQQLLQDCQRQLAETNTQWTKDVAQLQDKITENTDKSDHDKSTMQQQIAALQIEKNHFLGMQNDLKQSVQKFRDQIRMDSVHHQQLQQEIRSLSDKCQQYQDEIQQLDKLKEDEKAFLASKMEQMEKSLKSQCQNLMKENGMLREELAKQLSENAQMQSVLLKNRADQDEIELDTQKKLKSMHLVLLFGRVLQRKKMSYFRNWAKQATLCTVAQNFKDNMSQILQTVQQDTKRLQLETIEKVNKQWNEKMTMELASEANKFKEQLAQREQELQNQTMQKMANLQEEHEALLQQLESDHHYDLQRLHQQCQNLQDEHIKKIEDLRDKWEEEKSREIQLLREAWEVDEKEHVASLEGEFAQRAKETETAYAKGIHSMKEEMKKQFESELTSALTRQDKALSNQFHVLETQYKEEKYRLEEQLKNLSEEKEREMAQRWANETAVWYKEQEKVQLDKLAAQRTSLYEEFEERLRKLRQTWHDEVYVVERQKWEDEFRTKWKDKEIFLQTQADQDRKAFQEQISKEFADKEQALLAQNELYLHEQRHQISIECAETVEKERKRFEESFHLQQISLQEQYKVKLEEQTLEFEKAKESFIEAEHLLLQEEMTRFSVKKEEEIRALIHAEHQRDMQHQKNHYESLLQQEKQRMETLKNDVVQKNHFFAQERAQLLAQISSFDLKYTALENLKRSELLTLQQDMQQERDLLQIKHQETISALSHSHAQDKKQLTHDLTQELTEKFTKEHEAQMHSLQDEHDKIMHQWQQDNTALVNQLEDKLHSLKNEKNELTEKLDLMSEKLESTEDVLYDTEKMFKQHKQQYALYQWQNAVRLMRLRQTYQRLLQQEEESCLKRIEKVQEEAKFPVYDMAYQLYKLSLYLHTWEMQRKQIQESFTSFKSADLKGLKKKIQVFAQEIDILSIEKDHLEENYQQIEEEISVMTQQVTEQEVLMKSLSTESAISVNGRINVAFARKKRRIDAEIERLLEHIELKKTQLTDQEARILTKQQQREEKENLLIDCERQLVSILIEQQKFLQHEVQQMGGYYEKTVFLLSVLRIFPWPPVNAVTNNEGGVTKYSSNSITEPPFEEIKTIMVKYKQQLTQQQQQLSNMPPFK